MTGKKVNWLDIPTCISAMAGHVNAGCIYRVGRTWVNNSGEPFTTVLAPDVHWFVSRNPAEKLEHALPEHDHDDLSSEDDIYAAVIRSISRGVKLSYKEVREALNAPYVSAKASVMAVPGYEILANVLIRAYDQAATGKGHERHASSLPFHEQPMQQISDLLNNDAGMAFQACKKIHEARGLEHDAKIRELLGAINYIAGMVIWHERHHQCAEAPTQKS